MNHKKNKQIGIIGAGDIGVIIAELLAAQSYDIKVYNRYHEVDGKPSPYWLSKQGKFMDVTDGLELPGFGHVELTHNLDDLQNSEFVIITAGAKRSSPEETREELARKNARIMQQFAELVAKTTNTIFLVISNPVDSLTQVLIEESARLLQKDTSEIAKRIFGVSLVDSMRLRNLIRTELIKKDASLANADIEGFALGEHGPTMVPIISSAKVNSQDISNFLSNEKLQEIAKDTILRGNDIIKLTGASSVSGPAYAAMFMVREIAEKPSTSLPCAYYDGEVVIGQMINFENQQFASVKSVELNSDETALYAKSKQALKNQYQNIVSSFKNVI